jgi:DNA-binding transcriptional LysR family regulator
MFPMDLVDLRLFLNVSESSSLTRGAERSHLSVPAASARIKNIEENVGVKLLYRSNHGVVLTTPGKVFLRYCEMMLEQLDDLRGELQDYVLGTKGRIRIVANITPFREYVPAVLKTFLKTHPDVTVDLREGRSSQVVSAVSEGHADIGIYTRFLQSAGLITLPYRTDRLVLVVSERHPLAGRKSVSFAETMDYDFVGVQEDISIYGHMVKVASETRKQLKCKVRVNINGFDAIIQLIADNIGIGILPEVFAYRFAQAMPVKVVPMSDPWTQRNWHICMRNREELSGLSRELVDLLLADAKAHGSAAPASSAPAAAAA